MEILRCPTPSITSEHRISGKGRGTTGPETHQPAASGLQNALSRNPLSSARVGLLALTQGRAVWRDKLTAVSCFPYAGRNALLHHSPTIGLPQAGVNAKEH